MDNEDTTTLRDHDDDLHNDTTIQIIHRQTWTPPDTLLPTATTTPHPHHHLPTAWSKLRTLPVTGISRHCAAPSLHCLVLLGNSAMFFGMNFWLASFTEGNNTFASMLYPAIAWAVFGVCSVVVVWCWKRKIHRRPFLVLSQIRMMTISMRGSSRQEPHHNSSCERDQPRRIHLHCCRGGSNRTRTRTTEAEASRCCCSLCRRPALFHH